MLCTNLQSINRVCGPTSGGISRVWIFDPYDFDFTQAVADPITGAAAKYTVVAIRETGEVPAPIEGAAMLPVKFQKEEAEYKFAQSRKGCSVKYEHSLEFQLADLDQSITNWNAAVDAAGCCCGVGLIIQLKSGKIFVAGERFVNDAEISIALELTQDGSSGTSGKLLDDFNGETVVIKGNHGRKLYEYSGTVQSIIDLEPA